MSGPSAQRDIVDPGPGPEHLVVLAHGFWGGPGSVAQLSAAIHAAHGRDLRLLVHNSEANFSYFVGKTVGSSHYTTTTGVEVGGRKLAEEIQGLKAKYPSLQRISLIGFSLGGLYVRAAAPLIEHLGLKPVNFITVASPHCGVRGHVLTLIESAMRLGVLGKTGEDLIFGDSRGRGGMPLLTWMSHPDSPHWKAVSRYPNRVIAANMHGDDKVPYYSAALVASHGVLHSLNGGSNAGTTTNGSDAISSDASSGAASETSDTLLRCHYLRKPMAAAGDAAVTNSSNKQH